MVNLTSTDGKTHGQEEEAVTHSAKTSDADTTNGEESSTKKAKSLAKTTTKSFHIMVAGYNGAATPYTFTPPSSLVVAGNTLQHEMAGDQPSWASFYSNQSMAYITGENEPGRVYAVNITKVTPKKEGSAKTLSLKVLGGGGSDGGAVTGGDGPVASCIARGILFIANYGSGSASALQLDEDGSIVDDDAPSALFNFTRVPEGSIGPVASRQDHSYAHQVAADPSERWVYVPDLGADMIHRLSIPESGSACEVDVVGSTKVAAGSGPRHIAFYRKKAGDHIYAYLASELSTTLTAFRVHESDGDLQIIGKPVFALPAGTDPGANKENGNTRTTSEVAVSPDGNFVYVGTRGDPKEDHVAVFKRNSSDGSVVFKQWYHSGGKNLRHFSLSPDADALYLAAAHQDSGSVTILARNKTDGSLTKTSAVISDFEQVAFAGFFTGAAADL
ncbi:3-carboxy-cis,cis-mucoante lactonizing enzyme [Microstroma glucosiphilum]|uniref:3-carboxy-cis,cis-mucoante lactonizing enzyme n=1 Tax=Pseudomicrostroma glucosiphilum TaxID=1684307 RepID=A0A316U6P4_9BASI|nr:3-carboxy-cis,cis-mucoante lactonizing enzyme [Pseudomicrostroma glucosiphilum]PWN20494.1 3-carboxy-cis,cis-mucoante lactonizing enzyme [Pseudomicrostroma glucosiphilum]